MRNTLVISALVALTSLAPLAVAEPIELYFAMPAQVGGIVQIDPEWTFLFFERGSAANLAFAADAGGTVEVVSYPLADVRTNGTETMVGHPIGRVSEPDHQPEVSAWTLQAGLHEAGSFLFVRGASLNLTVESPTASLMASRGDAGGLVPSGSTDAFPYWWWEHEVNDEDVAIAATSPDAKTFTIDLSGVSELAWAGMTIDCNPAQYCPVGGGRQSSRIYLPLDSALGAGEMEYVHWRGTGILAGNGSVGAALAGGPALDLGVQGWSRMPKADLARPCDSCALDGEGTLRLSGRFGLAGIRSEDRETLHGRLEGEGVKVQVDEIAVEPTAIGLVGLAATGAAATAAAAVILKLLFAPLFTRLSKDEALEHPRRKQIFDYIQKHPGANFREVARNTHIAAGTVRHHLNVLERSGQVVEHQYGSTVRLFENQGKFHHNWSDLVLLREPALGKLHDWLKANPNSPQKALLEAMEIEGWSRSTSQHRLSRLVDGGIVGIRLQGRLKMYSVIERMPAKAGWRAPDERAAVSGPPVNLTPSTPSSS